MKTSCITIVVALSIFGSGCYTAYMGDTEVEAGEHNQISLRTVEQIVPKFTFLSENKGHRHYALELNAQGEFFRHNGVKMVTREQYLCFGLMPGIATFKWSENTRGDNEIWAYGCFISVLFANGILCGTPTFSSLFFEPFKNYYGEASDPCFSDLGLIGCRKYLKEHKGQRRVERSVERCTTQQLFGYRVSIDGENNGDSCSWTKGGSGTPLTNYTGRAFFQTTKSAGDKVKVKLLTVPVIRGDSEDKLTDLVGVEMEAVLP